MSGKAIVRWADCSWVLSGRRKCACYGLRPREGLPVTDWRYEGRVKVCVHCGLPLRVWHYPVPKEAQDG